MRSQPVLGVEIIVLSRFQQQWRDFTSGDLAGGLGALDFEVPPEHSLEGDNEGRYEFRFFHFGNADLAITSVDLERLPEDSAFPSEPQPMAAARPAEQDLAWPAHKRRRGCCVAA